MSEIPASKLRLQRIGRSTIVDQVEQQIRDKILSQEFPANLKLPSENEMAAIFSISRPTVREAICRLERAGLVDVRHGTRGGVYVRDVTVEPVIDSLSMILRLKKTTLEELLEARRLVETWAAECAAVRATQEDIDRLETSLVDLEHVLEGGDRSFDLEGFTQANLQFHSCVAEAAKNKVLLITTEAVRHLLEDLFKNLHLEYRNTKSVPDMHRKIFAAIAAHDPQLARQRMHEHLSGFEKRVLGSRVL